MSGSNYGTNQPLWAECARMGQLLQETAADSLQKVPARPRYLQLSRLVSRAGCCRCTKLKTSTSVPSHSVGSSCKVAASRNLPDAHRACTGCNRVYVARQKALNLVHGAHNSGMDEAACQENWDKFDNSLPDEIEVSCYMVATYHAYIIMLRCRCQLACTRLRLGNILTTCQR